MVIRHTLVLACTALLSAFAADAFAETAEFGRPTAKSSVLRDITIEDVARLRSVLSIEVAPNGRHFAVLLKHAEPFENQIALTWYFGDIDRSRLQFLADGGAPEIDETGQATAPEARWSHKGERFAFVRNAKQILLVHPGEVPTVLTNASDRIQTLVWHPTDEGVLFSSAANSDSKAAWLRERMRSGFRYSEDGKVFTDYFRPTTSLAPETDVQTVWLASTQRNFTRRATEAELAAFHSEFAASQTGIASIAGFAENSTVVPARRSDGTTVSLQRVSPRSRYLRVTRTDDTGRVETCRHAECEGIIERVWWESRTQQIYFWKHEGINDTAQAIYALDPTLGKITRIIARNDEDWSKCQPVQAGRVLCARETKSEPPHLALLHLHEGSVTAFIDLNPEFARIRLGRIERLEWDTPSFSWSGRGSPLNGVYPARAYGYVMYPPNFDAHRRYPLFVDPYTANGFEASAGGEHPLHVYAANNMIVLNTAFPVPNDVIARLGPGYMGKLYNSELSYPHLSMYAQSTFDAIDLLIKRGFIDSSRIGIGGVSHGTFVPLYMVQMQDRFAAVSVSSPTWGPHEYYWGTARLRRRDPDEYTEWRPRPEGAGADFWNGIDLAMHTPAIEAPILMNVPDFEIYALLRLMRHMEDSRLPFDTYVFTDETHFKHQPAHLYAIMQRNVDWFRYWLQDVEDPSPLKADQYASWRNLRVMQCQNPRSVRNFCSLDH